MRPVLRVLVGAFWLLVALATTAHVLGARDHSVWPHVGALLALGWWWRGLGPGE